MNEFGNIEIKKNSKGKYVINHLGDIYKIARFEVFATLKLVKQAVGREPSVEEYIVDENGKVGPELSNLHSVKWLEFDRDCYETPDYIFNWLDSRFNFNLDGCATKENCKDKFGRYLSDTHEIGKNFLNFDANQFRLEQMEDPRIFVNPPYSDVKPFLEQAKKLCDQGCLVVFLLNDDKSTTWYTENILNVANEVINIAGGRISFIHPITKEQIKGNSKGQMIVVFDPCMEDFIQRTVRLSFIEKVGGV